VPRGRPADRSQASGRGSRLVGQTALGSDAAQVRPGGLGAEPFGVVSCRDEQQRSGVGADPVAGQQPGGLRCHERADEVIEAFDLWPSANSARRPSSRSAMRVA